MCWVESTIWVAADRLAVLVADRDLALGVGAEHGGAVRLGLARLREVLEDLVGVEIGAGISSGRLVAGVAEHDALVARALVLVAGGIDALRDVGGLGVQQDLDVGVLPVEAVLLVADVLDGRAGQVDDDARRSTLVGAAVPRRRSRRGSWWPGSRRRRGRHGSSLGAATEEASTTSSEIRSQTLSGWPSETDSLVKR